MILRWIDFVLPFVFLALLHHATLATAQCPTTIRSPCICATTRYEPISISCDNAGNLQNVIASLGNVGVLIDSLTISNTPVQELPAFAFSNLAIKRLELSNNGLISIHPNAFDAPITQTLMELEIRHNSIGEIPQSGITALRALRTLVLSKCGIRSIPDNAFMTYESRGMLTRLDLSSNRLQQIKANAFNGLTSLKELSFFKNFLTSIPTAALAPLTSLEDLALGVNNIRQVPIGALQFAALKSLSLEANHIEIIPRDAFQLTSNLLYLYVSNNRFTQISPDMFYYIPRLRVLYMGGNERLRRITTNAFQYIPDLVRLELPDCDINVIEDGAMERIKKVQVIDLKNNKIERITALTFQNMDRLISLNLQGNNLSDVQDSSFANLPQLKLLDISNNQLTSLDSATFYSTFARTLPATSRVLYLFDNPWECTTRISWLRQWLRQEPDIKIDKPAHNLTTCVSPAELNGLQFRQSDPTSTESAATQAPYGQSTNVYIGGFGGRGGGSANMGVAAIILGIILGIFCLSLLLLLVVRYFVIRNRALQKADDEYRLASSGTSSYRAHPSSYGSAFPSSAEPLGSSLVRPQTYAASAMSIRNRQQLYGTQANMHMRHNGGEDPYFMNRPWYWWF